MKGLLTFLVIPALAVADYSDLIAALDGSAVVFRYSNSFSNSAWYRWSAEGVVPYNGIPTPDGKVVASAGYSPRRCNFAGSTCFLAAPCSAGWSITTPQGSDQGSLRRTELRVSREGNFVWFQQSESECRGMSNLNAPSDPRKNGVYRLPGLQQISSVTGRLASDSLSARVFTADGQVLLLSGGRLSLSGRGPLAHSPGVREGTISENGAVVAYEDGTGSIWLSIPAPFPRYSLVGRGSSPRLSDDGSTLAFVSENGHMRVLNLLDGWNRTGEPVTQIALSGDGRWIFAVDREDNLIRIDVTTMQRELLVKRVFRGQVWTARVGESYCPLPCYDSSPYLKIYAGHLVILQGDGFDDDGWTVGIGDLEIPLRRLLADQVWFQVPASVRQSPFRFRIFNHGHPVEFYSSIDSAFDGSVGCLGALHQDGEPVSHNRPARVGDIVSLFFTGVVRQTEPAPEDRLIPISIRLPDSVEILWAGLAPGLFGVQQANVRVLRVPEPGAVLIQGTPSCTMPPIE